MWKLRFKVIIFCLNSLASVSYGFFFLNTFLSHFLPFYEQRKIKSLLFLLFYKMTTGRRSSSHFFPFLLSFNILKLLFVTVLLRVQEIKDSENSISRWPKTLNTECEYQEGWTTHLISSVLSTLKCHVDIKEKSKALSIVFIWHCIKQDYLSDSDIQL